MRSDLDGPPGGVWNAVCDGELAPDPNPAVIIEDLFLYHLEERARTVRHARPQWSVFPMLPS